MKFVLFFGFCFALVAVSLTAPKSVEVPEIIALVDEVIGTIGASLEAAVTNIQNETNIVKAKILEIGQLIEDAEKASIHDAYITALNNANASSTNAQTTLNSVASIYSVQYKIPTNLQTRLLNDVTIVKAELSTLKEALPVSEETPESLKELNKKTNKLNNATKDLTNTLATIITATLSVEEKKEDGFIKKLLNTLG